jgi:hypothetical protein
METVRTDYCGNGRRESHEGISLHLRRKEEE